MVAELISALFDAVMDEGKDTLTFSFDAVRQTDNPSACLLQTARFVRAESQRRPSTGNPDIAWMRARCAACGICRADG